MTTEEKLQLIDESRLKFAQTIRDLLADDEDIGTDIAVDISFYSTFREYTNLLSAAKNLGWQSNENKSRWYVSPNRFGDTTIFYK